MSEQHILTDKLDGAYTRVYLSALSRGLSAETLARLFCLSAKKEPDGKELLEEKLQVARELIADRSLPLDIEDFDQKLADWLSAGYPAIHHSDAFRSEYRPAYRVIADRYAEFLALFTEIDKLLSGGSAIVTLEGGSASGKSTLAEILCEVYDCNVFHADDFFLRPEQRTPERFAEIGGNLDRERFYDEIIVPLTKNETVTYRPFDCGSQTLDDPITVLQKKLTIVEGVYSTHPAFSRYYDLAVFLDIDPEYQKKRILARNSPRFAERFFNEWIPLENRYFEGTEIKKRSDLIIPVNDKI
jgi:uridine kinase